jgi:Flp pilus assembly protein TadG
MISLLDRARPPRLMRLRARLRRLLRSQRGAVTIELVIIVPLMVLLLLGFSEMYLYMRAVSTVEHTAFMLTDSIGQMTEIIDDDSTSNSNNLGSLWNAATFLAAPTPLQASGGVIVTSVCDGPPNCVVSPISAPSMAPGAPGILWQQQAPWTASGMTSRVTTNSILPSTYPFRTGDSVVVVEIFCNFNPFSLLAGLWPGAPGTQTIYRRVYGRPRAGTPLPLVSG